MRPKECQRSFLNYIKREALSFALCSLSKVCPEASERKIEVERQTDRQTDEMKIVYMVGLIAAVNVSSF